MRVSKILPIAVAVVFPLIIVGAMIFGPSLFHSEDYAFTQLMGCINKGDTRVGVRWTYIQKRAFAMRLAAERSDLWRISGRWQGEPANLVVRFSNSRVDGISLEPNYTPAQVP